VVHGHLSSLHCALCAQVFAVPAEMMPEALPSVPNVTSGVGVRDIVDNGVDRPWGDEGYSEIISFVSPSLPSIHHAPVPSWVAYVCHYVRALLHHTATTITAWSTVLTSTSPDVPILAVVHFVWMELRDSPRPRPHAGWVLWHNALLQAHPDGAY
jgi:hypothetical protein